MAGLDLYGNQFHFAFSDARFAALLGGIGSGKSIGGVFRAFRASQGFVGQQPIPTPNLGVVTAPTYPMLRDSTLRAFTDLAGDYVADYQKTESRALMANGSEILFRSADKPDRLRGPSISWWHGDEAAFYHKDVWRVMIGRLRQGGRFGYGWITTTPKGRNWVYQEFAQRARDAYALYKVKTGENPFIDAEYYAALADAYSGDFARQELDGDFVAFEGLVYPEFSQDIHVVSQTPPTFAYTLAGVDWGYVHPGVINVYGVDGDGRMWLVHEEVARKRRIEEWAVAARGLQDTFDTQVMYCDSAEPDFIQAFQHAGVRAEGATKDVLPGIQAVKARLAVRGDGKPRLLYGSWCRHNITEKEQYQWLENRDGFRDAPKKLNDDCSDAERYAVMGVDGDFLNEALGAVHHAAETAFSASDY